MLIDTLARHKETLLREHREQEESRRLAVDYAVKVSWAEPRTHGIMGRRFPDGVLLRYRKCVPQQLGDVIVVTNSPPIGHMRSQLTNHQVGTILDVQAWSKE